MPDYLEICEEAARSGGQVLLDWWGRFEVREKGPRDLVTQADLNAQKSIRDIVMRAFPDHGFVGEEEDTNIPGESEFRWIVDPLDGTTNYVHRVPHFSVSIALERAGELVAGVVYHPPSGQCFKAAAGEGAFLDGERLRVSDTSELPQALVAASFSANVERGSDEITRFVEILLAAQAARREGSAALNLAYLAAGRYDAYYASSTKIWDVAAGILLVREAGGIVTSLSGGDFDLDRAEFLAAATPALHGEMLRLFELSNE